MKEQNGKAVKVALVGSYTLGNIEKPLHEALAAHGFIPMIQCGEYGQFIQELLTPGSFLYSFNPDIICIALSTRTFLSEVEFKVIDGAGKEYIEEKMRSLKEAVQSYKGDAMIFLTSLDIPAYSPYGFADSNSRGLKGMIREANNSLASLSDSGHVSIVDFDSIASTIGKDRLTDEKLFYLGKIFLSEEAARIFSKEIASLINAAFGNSKKCLVVDLDNTLWGGVIGEDGIENVQLGDTNLGVIYQEIQKIIKNFRKTGILLAIASKNNEQDVLPMLNDHKHMILKDEDFIAKRINWQDKSNNIKEIAEELNIGLGSIVVLDDNPVERLEIREHLPQVEVIEAPEDIAEWPMMLRRLPFFARLELTEEDKKRHEMYMAEGERMALKKTVSVEQYLFQLDIAITLQQNPAQEIDRITQLINKTNQFNLCTKRYTHDQVRNIISSSDCLLTAVRARDKFGDMGLVGVIIIRTDSGEYHIDTFLLSCRVLARKIEDQFLQE
ncbi:HAD-IIIC family phosphatase, partial [Candidatus Woesearchaeota archaeon]|nr:HAD-IIIC family phosphatase [Candidatus Woesearchaeota archaeon]